MRADLRESDNGLPAELRDGDERLDWEADPPLDPPPDDGTEEDYPAPID